MKNKVLLPILTCLFLVLFSATVFVSYSGNVVENEVVVKSITPVYDVSSGIVVDQKGVIFNDKNQVVNYKVVIENTQDYDVKINNISLTTPTEEFLSFEVEDIQENDVVKASSTKEINISFETMGIEGWGRNFNDELTANISFEKVAKQEEVIPPKEETPKEDDKPVQEEVPNEETPEQEKPSKPSEGGQSSKPIPQPEAPIKDEKELIKNVEKMEEVVVTSNTIELPKEIKVSVGEKLAVWIYSEPIFLGYFDVVVENGIKKIEGLEAALAKADITAGDHNIVLVSNEETIGYVPVSINENKKIIMEENLEDESIENPYTSDNKLLFLLIIATGTTGLAIISVSRNKFTKYTVFILMLSPVLTTNAEESIELSIKTNVSFKSQNVMKMAYTLDGDEKIYGDFWKYAYQIANIYISNDIEEIKEFVYQFDVSQSQKGRVKAYLTNNHSGNVCFDEQLYETDCFDLHIQADGIIYPNANMSYYFANMLFVDKIVNLEGIDTSEVTNMSYMFYDFGLINEKLKLDVSSLDTSSVVDMSSMFEEAGGNSTEFILDVSNFDTSNVTNMRNMFFNTGLINPNFTLDVSGFDTSKVTNMSGMFGQMGISSKIIELNLSNFDTSNVTDMSYMFSYLGESNPNFKLDVSNFDTSKVTDMSYMFSYVGYNSKNFTLDVSNFDTSNVTSMKGLFQSTGYNSTVFDLDVSNFDTSMVTDIEAMFLFTGYNSKEFNATINLKNKLNSYDFAFDGVANNDGTSLKINYISELESLLDEIFKIHPVGRNVTKGNLIVDVDNLSTGDEIHISGEKFNVISQTDDIVTMLAQYNLSTDYRQSTTANGVKFSDTSGWEYTPGPKEIDIQTWSKNPKIYVNAYVEYLKIELGDDSVTGNLITLKELQTLGCATTNDYAQVSTVRGDYTCTESEHSRWLNNNQKWWTRSANSGDSDRVWVMISDGNLGSTPYGNYNGVGVRPVITISKETLKNLN